MTLMQRDDIWQYTHINGVATIEQFITFSMYQVGILYMVSNAFELRYIPAQGFPMVFQISETIFYCAPQVGIKPNHTNVH